MGKEPLIGDDGEARELTDEDFANMRIGDPDITGPVTLPVQAALLDHVNDAAHSAIGDMVVRAKQLRTEADALEDAAKRLDRALPPAMRRFK